MIILAAVAQEREEFSFRYSYFEQAVKVTDYICATYKISVIGVLFKLVTVYDTIRSPQNRSTVFFVVLLISSISAAAFMKYLSLTQ